MQKYKKYLTNIAIVWMVFFALVLFAYFIFIRPQGKIRYHLEKELSEKKQIYADARSAARDETKKRMDAELDELGKQLGELVIDSDASGNLIFDISQIASEKNVSSFSIKTQDSGDTHEIPGCLNIGDSRINISFVSDFNRFASLLNELERHQPVVFIETFSIRRDQKSSLKNEVSMGVSVLVKKRQDS